MPYKIDKLVNTALWDTASLRIKTETIDKSKYFADASAIGLTDPFNNAAPNLKPMAGSAALTTTADFALPQLGDAFFDKVSFIGALDATNDWTTGWTVWGK